MKSLSFDGLVERYDETRSFDRGCFDSALQYITASFPVSSYSTLLEPGIGSGRIAIPFANLGYRVTGIDISEEMLSAFQKRIRQESMNLPIASSKADITQMPFPNGAFDLVVVVHMFYFLQDWKRAVREILRVVRADGPIVLMHTGKGTEVPFLNERYKELCALRNNPIPAIGVASTREAVEYFQSLGCAAQWIQDRWRWTARISCAKALEYIKVRAYSFTAATPDGIHAEVVGELETELLAKHGSLDTIIEVPNQIYLVLLKKR